jgi:hypothetical protein
VTDSTPSIIDALDHPAVFGPFFKAASWQPWRAFLKAMFALPMDDEDQELYTRCTGRTEPPALPFKEACLVIGRRGGKSRMLALIACYLATFRSYDEYLAPGEVAVVAVIAASRAQARSIFQYLDGLLRAVPALDAMLKNEKGKDLYATQEVLTLNNRVRIEIHTASFRVTRGYTFAAVLADETAFWRDESSANPDGEIFRALRPGLATIPGALLLNASSPYRKAGVLFTTHRRFFGKNDGRVLVWQADTLTMNPALDPSVVEEAYEDDAESASAEFGAQFRDDISDFVSRDLVDAVTIPGRQELLPADDVGYFAFVDPSGGSSDSMTLAIAHRSGDIAVLDAIRERKPPFSPEDVVAEFTALLKTFRIKRVTGDRYAGEWPRERFKLAGITYDISEQPKGEIYTNTLPLLNSRKVELLDHPRLAAQLCGLERRTSRSGRDSIDHAPGGHDDICNAACGALLMVRTKRPPMKIDPALLDKITPIPGSAGWHRRHGW